MKITARPGPNGNSRDDFVAAAYKLKAAETAFQEALAELRGSVFHGRNYQHLPGVSQDAGRAGDDSIVNDMYASLRKMNQLYDGIVKAVMS